MIELQGKTAIVTGGSRGIGRAVCLLLAGAGADVAFGYRHNSEAAESVVREIEKQGGKALAVVGDVTRQDTFERLFSETKDQLGSVDIVVGNAGIWKGALIDEMTGEEWQETLDVNLNSIFWTCRYAAREMKPKRSGKIVLISSTAGQRGEAGHSHYAATKGAIIALTKSLGTELGPFNINVNCVAPGWVDTDMCTGVFADPDFRESVRQEIPLKRIATAEEIAGAVLFLASELARHIQGEILNVNGGSVLCG